MYGTARTIPNECELSARLPSDETDVCQLLPRLLIADRRAMQRRQKTCPVESQLATDDLRNGDAVGEQRDAMCDLQALMLIVDSSTPFK